MPPANHTASPASEREPPPVRSIRRIIAATVAAGGYGGKVAPARRARAFRVL
jgi:hypothetical protein